MLKNLLCHRCMGIRQKAQFYFQKSNKLLMISEEERSVVGRAAAGASANTCMCLLSYGLCTNGNLLCDVFLNF